jgi:hypothetical protein
MKGHDKLKKTNMELLRERIERNYSDYRRIMLELCSDCVYEFAPEIAAVNEVYSHVTDYNWTSEEIAGFLLRFDNPMKIIVDEWRGYTHRFSEGFGDFAREFTRDFLGDGPVYYKSGDGCDDDDGFYEDAEDDAESRSAYFSELIGYCEKQLGISIYGVIYSENGEGAGFCAKP